MAKKKDKAKIGGKVLIKNRRATHDYEILDTYTAGIVLVGTEIKSLRLGKASLVDTFCIVHNREVWAKNVYIAEYFYGSYNNHVARRDRKLLLNRKEIRELAEAVKNTGLTIVPLKLYINANGLAKLEIGIARGKKQYDKRHDMKERDLKRELDQARRRDY
ncbi:SsrA-binding protein SmpB [Porphyromonas levii]|uniref:SsrA-binding protein n=1 Tax=Porphyromonas levii TaxID=28114 RepID=A0A4Y8WQ84_9PORP|nr:SsrA-binding protein SmpB [Porphyromonas levii]MBR8704074.1 SsrA-binding protein [Porphyromonas levii]MBR8713835.1 SsrA-binding protein [Porphyromonas levii]MBR8715837.1 SsrA-binding protein [Porphyromonas levii]MBR8728382.1 SsrA-binding protein [Porphyromonas levii]MBR8730381.1 SsrA-binding protein [Porphyromonas levii]